MNAYRRNNGLRTLATLLTLALLVFALPALAQRGQEKRQQSVVAPKEPVKDYGRTDKAQPEIFFCETPTTECRTSATEFTLKQIRDLFVFSTWPGISGDHVQTVEFYLPDGSLYMKRETPFRVGVKGARAMQVPGGKVPDKYLSSSRRTATVITPFAVEGTYISQRTLTGQWSVRVLLDGKPAASAKFVIQPAERKAE